MDRTQQIKKAHPWLSNEEVVKVLIYSDQGLRWIKNTDGLNHQKEMDKFIDKRQNNYPPSPLQKLQIKNSYQIKWTEHNK